MRKLQIPLLVLLIILAGCKKEEIVTITQSTGKVIERSTNMPLSGIKVAVSNGQRDLVTTITDAEGRFEFTVDFDKVTASDSLLLDGRPDLPFKKYELKGIGKAEYDYGTLWLYDKSDVMYLPQVTTDSIISVDITSAVLSGTVSSDGGFTVTKRGVCYSPRQLPNFSDNVKAAGSGTGAFICEIDNLSPATEYYYRAFAINAIDTVFGEQKSFKTPAKTYSVSVSATPSDGGEVTGGGTYEEGSTQTVVATANIGYTFINWTENGNEVSTDASYSFTLNGNRTLVAHFQVKTYDITTSSNPANGGSTRGEGTYSHGQSCTLRATPANGFTFLRWTKNGTQVSTEPNYTFEVTGAGNYVANFTDQPLTFTVSVSANPANGGTATGGGTYEMGETCTVRATANSGHVFSNWTEGGIVVSEESNYTFPVAGDRTLKANFTMSQNACTVNVSANPTNGGTVTGGGSFNQGQSCTVTAMPNTGFVFVRWTENGVQVSDNPSYTFTVTSNRTLVAQFQMLTYTVSTSSNPSNGGVTSGGGTYQQGQQCAVTAVANAGFSFVNWTENGNVVSSSASYTFAVSSNRTLVANFASQTYTISVSANPGNGGGVSGGGTYSYGQSCTVTATAASGFNFVNWTEGVSPVSSNAEYTFIVTSSRELVANFLFIGGEGEWLHYDDGIYDVSIGNSGSIVLHWASMFPAESLVQYVGSNLTKVALYETEHNNDQITVSIYLGGDNAPGTMVSTMNYNPVGGDAFHEVILNTPVAINGAQNLWIVFAENDDYPANACVDTGEANNRWVSIGGDVWGDLAGSVPGYGWMIRGYVSFGRGDQPDIELKPNAIKPHANTNQNNRVKTIKID